MAINKALVDHYRIPEDFAQLQLLEELSEDCGYFRFGEQLACLGRTSALVRRGTAMGEGEDALPHARIENGQCLLPFDPTEVVDNFRWEQYCSHSRQKAPEAFFWPALKLGYYFLRPLLSVSLRSPLQRYALRNWKQRSFPNWPVDTSVAALFESLLRLLLAARSPEPIPFIWFWPHGQSGCVIMTHDVEEREGRDFCGRLMDLNEAAGIRASFQLVPEERYRISPEFLDSIRRRGFEINVHDFNHDGKLFSSRNVFKARALGISRYAGEFRARGFRSGSLHRQLAWIAELGIEYDMSVPNVAHLEAQGGGCCSIMPYFLGSVLELPVTMVQDYALFHFLNEYSTDLWIDQLNLVLGRYGLASFIVHPDYVREERAQAVYRKLLLHLRKLIDAGRAWMALPSEVNDWWWQRARMKLRCSEGRWAIDGPGSERARVAFARLVEGEVRYEVEDSPSRGLASAAEKSSVVEPPADLMPAMLKSSAPFEEATVVSDPARRPPCSVLVVSYSHYESDGRVRKSAECLAQRGDRVDVLSLRKKGMPRRETIRGVHVYRIQRRERTERGRLTYLVKILSFFVNSLCRGAVLHLFRRYRLVHVHSVPDFQVFAALVPKAMGARIILDIHDVMPELYASKFGSHNGSPMLWILRRLEKLSADFADHVIIANDLWKARLVERSVRPEKCTAILNYPDQSIFYPRSTKRTSGSLVFMYPGTLNQHQGVDIALKAFRMIRDRLPRAEFHIYGSGPDKTLLENLTSELGLAGRVLIRDSVRLEAIADKMAEADIGVIPKRSNLFGDEAFSTKSLEFMALGVPVIISRTRIDDYYFKDSVVKFFRPGDIESLAECMYELGSNAELRQRLAEGAAEFVKNMSWQVKKGDYLRLVDGLLSL